MNEKKNYSIENGYMSIHELLATNGVNQRNLINNLEREEQIDGRESYDMIEADIKANINKTNLSKERYINDIKGGLGDLIKKEPNTIKIIKKTTLNKFTDIIKKIFTKFWYEIRTSFINN